MTKERTVEQREHVRLVEVHLQVGDIITHRTCGAGIAEHVYIGKSGNWLCGRPTVTTYHLEGMTGGRFKPHNRADDISPLNITHINRIEVSALSFVDAGFLARTRRRRDKAEGK